MMSQRRVKNVSEMQFGKGSLPDNEVSLSAGAECVDVFISLSLFPLCERLVGAELSVLSLLRMPSAFVQSCTLDHWKHPHPCVT